MGYNLVVVSMLVGFLACTSNSEVPDNIPSSTVPNFMNSSLLDSNQEVEDDSGKIAWIVISVLGGLVLIIAVVAFFIYKQYVRRNVKSMNFDNPVYRKTTEDQFSLEKNQYQPARTYPAVSEETLEPLNNPGTNEFV